MKIGPSLMEPPPRLYGSPPLVGGCPKSDGHSPVCMGLLLPSSHDPDLTWQVVSPTVASTTDGSVHMQALWK
jgi:hypothetical protein